MLVGACLRAKCRDVRVMSLQVECFAIDDGSQWQVRTFISLGSY